MKKWLLATILGVLALVLAASEMSQTMYSGAAVAIVKDDEVIALEG